MASVTYYGTGRRKTAVARVRLIPGGGRFIVNGRPSERILSPAELTESN